MPSSFWEAVQDAFALVREKRVTTCTTPNGAKVYEVPQPAGHPRLIRIDIKEDPK